MELPLETPERLATSKSNPIRILMHKKRIETREKKRQQSKKDGRKEGGKLLSALDLTSAASAVF